MEDLNDLALRNFKQYLQIPSVHPDVDYTKCVEFLKGQGQDIGLQLEVVYVKPNKPVVILTWLGERNDLPSVLLNSHMDVVPVFEEQWKYKPFNAEVHKGKIYARGSQDMKCVGVQYLEAIRRLKLEGIVCSRTVHVCFVPDEEVGGEEGMKLFIQTEDFKNLNVGVALDESLASENEEMILFYGEKCCWQFDLYCSGSTGHGSLLLDNTPGEKAAFLLQKFYDFREQQRTLLENHDNTLEYHHQQLL
ncbi:aminoacylase-1-like [Coccinella septempunctata]|uniref:aminoacylase-1-like n=1 Tax=Coccinella septempunctata TaxID=41139 RepID=UPI001D06EAE8|nr:aminoacylase-1-like [Coccinella septempunctata]